MKTTHVNYIKGDIEERSIMKDPAKLHNVNKDEVAELRLGPGWAMRHVTADRMVIGPLELINDKKLQDEAVPLLDDAKIKNPETGAGAVGIVVVVVTLVTTLCKASESAIKQAESEAETVWVKLQLSDDVREEVEKILGEKAMSLLEKRY